MRIGINGTGVVATGASAQQIAERIAATRGLLARPGGTP